MKTIKSFLIAGVLLLTQFMEAGERGGGVGFALPARGAPSATEPGATAPAPQNNPPRTVRQGVTVRRGNLPQGSAPQQGQTQKGQNRNQNQTNSQNGRTAAATPPTGRHEWHSRDWWRHHFRTIVFVLGGYYYWDGGYWYPANGYDPNYYYSNDDPIYAYGNLLPDQVIEQVQSALRQDGYYFGPINGSLNSETRAAIANYQRAAGLPVTAAVDEPTVESLGLA